MSFQGSCYRQVTPPAGYHEIYYDQESCSPSSYWQSNDVSPNSVDTHYTTPPRSPPQHYGPLLLPRIRTQDVDGPFPNQLKPRAGSGVIKHRKSRSSSTGPTAGYVASVANPALFRRSLSPAFDLCNEDVDYHQQRASSVPRTNAQFAHSLLAPTIQSRSASVSAAHSRSTSGQSVDLAAICHYAIHPYGAQTHQPASRKPSLATIILNPPMQPIRQATPPQQLQPSEPQQGPLAPELLFENYAEMPDSTTLLDFLTGPNPSMDFVRKMVQPNRFHDTHFWWDVRNIRTWNEFNLQTILSVPGLASLLTNEIPEPALPKPCTPSSSHETVSQLHDAYASFFSTKINAALKVALGNSFPKMTSNKTAAIPANPRGAPADFTAHYESDYERTLFGEPKARVVGLVRTFNQWNSGMRSGESAANASVEYRRELACLHRHMREHGCRYGFIVTEVELVCVRAGTDSVPYFGYLEVAPAVKLSTHGKPDLPSSDASEVSTSADVTSDKTGSSTPAAAPKGHMTAALALWFLHMLAKNTPLEGQPGWKIDVGGPAALTRQHCLEKDRCPFKPEGREKRDAKRNRGWVMPEDPLSRKECGRGRKVSRGS